MKNWLVNANCYVGGYYRNAAGTQKIFKNLGGTEGGALFLRLQYEYVAGSKLHSVYDYKYPTWLALQKYSTDAPKFMVLALDCPNDWILLGYVCVSCLPDSLISPNRVLAREY